jgi:hypothetical protein
MPHKRVPTVNTARITRSGHQSRGEAPATGEVIALRPKLELLRPDDRATSRLIEIHNCSMTKGGWRQHAPSQMLCQHDKRGQALGPSTRILVAQGLRKPAATSVVSVGQDESGQYAPGCRRDARFARQSDGAVRAGVLELDFCVPERAGMRAALNDTDGMDESRQRLRSRPRDDRFAGIATASPSTRLLAQRSAANSMALAHRAVRADPAIEGPLPRKTSRRSATAPRWGSSIPNSKATVAGARRTTRAQRSLERSPDAGRG